MLKFFSTFFTITLCIAGCAKAQSGPQDLDFEGVKITEDRVSQKWFAPKKEYTPHYKTEIVSGNAYSGKECAEISSTGTPTEKEFGNVMQYFDATPFRGKTVRFRAAVRIESASGGQARMWMRVDRKDQAMGFFDNMGDRPIASNQWKVYEIKGTVHPDAEKINIGCMLIGEGKVFFDAVQFDVLTGKDALPLEPEVTGPTNLDFEEAQLGNFRHGWFDPGIPHYSVKLVTDGAYKGKQYAEIYSTGKPTAQEFGNVMQSFEAQHYRGKTVRFRGAVRVNSTDSGDAQMWMRVDRKNRKMGYFDNMNNRPITDGQWKQYDITGTIDTDAMAINIGCMLIGQGKADFDAVSFDVVDEHPPASSLNPIRLFPAGSNPEQYKMETTDGVNMIKYTAAGSAAGFGTYMLSQEPGEWLGKRIKMSAMIRTENVEDWCGMWFRADGNTEKQEVLDFDNMKDRPIKGTTDWKKYEITVNVPKEATGVAYGVLVHGKGAAYFKDIAFEVVGEAKPVQKK